MPCDDMATDEEDDDMGRVSGLGPGPGLAPGGGSGALSAISVLSISELMC